MNRDWVVRPVRAGEGEGLYLLANALGHGMTTLPADRGALEEKIAASVESFEERRPRLDGQYLLVLEDIATHELLGTAAVYANVGTPYGFFSYKRIRLVQRSRALEMGSDVELLTPANDYTGATEVGSLAVRPELKGTGAGRLLARSRYLLIATRPELFAPTVMAEMRGWQDERGCSPFWNAVGAHFFDMDFPTADRLSALRGSDFISELLPRHPIYIDLLPESARAAIGRPHDSSAPAMALLRREGFRFEGYVDVFDAGPQMHVERDSIATVRSSQVAELTSRPSSSTLRGEDCVVSVDNLARFRVTQAAAVLRDGKLVAAEATMATLEVIGNDAVRVCPADPGDPGSFGAGPRAS